MKENRSEAAAQSVQLSFWGKVSPEEVFFRIPEAYIIDASTGTPLSLQGTTNLLIHGDNLPALNALCSIPSVEGHVRLIYIDPPFSTGLAFKVGNARTATISASRSDAVAFADTLSGEKYLAFLYERLVVLHRLLAASGSIYLHIDSRAGHYVKVLMDEIFGVDNFRNDIARIKCNPKNFSRRGFGNVKDMVLFYAKSAEAVWNEPRVPMHEEDVERLFPKTDASGRRYATTPLHAPGETREGKTGQPWNGMAPPAGRHWRVSPEELTHLDTSDLIEWSPAGNPRKKIFADDAVRHGKKLQDVWEFKDPPYPLYPTEKNIGLLRLIIGASSNPGDLVLDCFAGSGTALIAAEELHRRWIGIDEAEPAIAVAASRLAATDGIRPFQRCISKISSPSI